MRRRSAICDLRSHVAEMRLRKISCLGARGLSSTREPQQRPHGIDRKAKFACPPHERQPADVPRFITPVSTPAMGDRKDADSLIIADCLNVAAGLARELADRYLGAG